VALHRPCGEEKGGWGLRIRASGARQLGAPHAQATGAALQWDPPQVAALPSCLAA
jgi:hypothetical protein